MLWVVLGGLLAVGTVGCGNKGPLVLPAKPSAAVVGEPEADLAEPAPAADAVDTDTEAEAEADDADAQPLPDEPAAVQPGA